VKNYLGLSVKDSSMPEAANSLITTIMGGLAVTTTRSGVHVRTALARASSVAPSAKSATSAPSKTVAAARTTSGAAPARPAASKQQGATKSPFSQLMGGFRSPAATAQPTVKTMRFPEMVGGIATGRRVEVRVPSSATPKIDATSTAKKILAAGARARGGK
jgi:hypothetical protein